MTFKNNDFEAVLTGRKSVRRFDPSAKISREEMNQMLTEATTAPSSCNLQSWHFVVVDTPAGKDKLRQYFMKFNTTQIDTASAFVLVFGDLYSYESYRDLWQQTYESGQITAAQRDEVLRTFLPMYEGATPEFLATDSTIDASLIAMQLMLIAQAHGYVTNPLGGYDATKAATTFGLDPKRYVPVMAIAMGKPATGSADATLSIDAPRYPVAQVTEYAD